MKNKLIRSGDAFDVVDAKRDAIGGWKLGND